MQGGQAVCDGENRGAAFLLHFLDLGLDALFGGVVQRGGGLVQYQDAGFFEEDAGQRDALALTAGEVGSTLGQHELIPALQLLDVGGNVGLARRLPDLLRGNLALHAVADVVVDRIRDKKRRLGHERHVFSQNGARERIERNAAQQHFALRLLQLVDHLDERGFAAAAGTGDTDELPCRNRQHDVIENQLLRLFGVGEAHVLQRYAVVPRRPGLRSALILTGEIQRQIGKLEVVVCQHHAFGKFVQNAVQLPKRAGKLGKAQISREHRTHRNGAP